MLKDEQRHYWTCLKQMFHYELSKERLVKQAYRGFFPPSKFKKFYEKQKDKLFIGIAESQEESQLSCAYVFLLN